MQQKTQRWTKLTQEDVFTNNRVTYTVVMWQDRTGFGAHRISINYPVMVVYLRAKNERSAFNRAVNEWASHERTKGIKRGNVTIIEGFKPVTNYRDRLLTITLQETF